LRLGHLAALVAAAAIAVICGCASSGNSSELHADRHPIGVLGSGFIDPAAPPAPEATITPKPGSWDSVRPPRDYRVVLLTAGDDSATTTLVTAVKKWAKAEHVMLETVATTESKAVDAIVEAINRRSDLVVCAGNSLVDALALVTASFLDQQFLVVGAQLPEPTVNVTAAIWRGASSRGGEVRDTATSFDPDAFTPEDADAAIRAGVASVLSDLTGIVIWLG
jgi:basic membrane lipoprotein Med (substrate-binding protein (PBP1-ABC) superfamily)